MMTTLLLGPMHFFPHFLLILHYEFQPRDVLCVTLACLFQPSEPLQSDTRTNTHTQKFPLLFSLTSWEALSCSLKAVKVAFRQWRSRFLEIFKLRRYFTLILFFLRPPAEMSSFRTSDATSLWMYQTRASITFSQALVYRGMLFYHSAQSSSKWPCRDSVLQVAKPSPAPKPTHSCYL